MSNQEEIDVIIDRRDLDEGLGVHAQADAMDYEWREETLLEHIARSARENPASAALVGAGFVWMALGGARKVVRAGAGGAVGDAARAATSKAGETARAVGEAVASTAESAQEAAARAGRTIVRTARAGAGAVEKTSAQAAEVAGRETSLAQDYAESAARRTASAVSQAREEISGELRDAVVAVRRGSERARRAASDLAQNQPCVLSALCLVAGAGIAALLPRTRTENELLGEYKEEVVHTARSRAADLMAGGVSTVRARTSEAVHEAARKAADEAAEQVLRQAGGIGEAAVETFDKVIRDGGSGTGAKPA